MVLSIPYITSNGYIVYGQRCFRRPFGALLWAGMANIQRGGECSCIMVKFENNQNILKKNRRERKERKGYEKRSLRTLRPLRCLIIWKMP